MGRWGWGGGEVGARRAAQITLDAIGALMGDDEGSEIWVCVCAYRRLESGRGVRAEGSRGELLRRAGMPPPTGAARGTIKDDGMLAKVLFSFLCFLVFCLERWGGEWGMGRPVKMRLGATPHTSHPEWAGPCHGGDSKMSGLNIRHLRGSFAIYI